MIAPLGNRLVDEIPPQDVIAALQKVEERGALDIAKRLRQSTEKVFALAKVRGLVASNPATTDLNIALKRTPRRSTCRS